jgi:hypothetical protein
MNIQLKILESDSQIASNILKALKPQVDEFIKKRIPKIEIALRESITDMLKNEPEYQSLMSGRLKYEFGLPNEVNIDTVVEILANTVSISTEQSVINNRGISIKLKLTALSKDGEPAISSSDAFVVDAKGGYALPWLEWLLFKGTEPIVKNYSVRIGQNPFSRSGMAIMVESNKNWRVPSEFAGSINNNWMTRAIDKNEDKIEKQIISIFNE